MIIIVIIVIISVGLYYLYIRLLPKNECDFLNEMYGTLDGSIHSLVPSDPNCKYALNDYYIKTAYNCCSMGSYRNDFVGLCALKNILKQGVRGLDFEIFSKDDKAVVATSTSDSYFIKETYNSIDFSDIMKTIVNYAFSSSTAPNPRDPIIIHLRIKSTNQKMYQNMADIFKNKDYDRYMLGSQYSEETYGKNFGLTPLLSLMGKIIIIVDRSNTSFLENKGFYEYVNMTSNSMFCRVLPYYNIQYPSDVNELIEFNKRSMTIAIPDKGTNPPNPSGLIIRETGCQLIAMRYQQIDTNLEENNLLFDQQGYAFVLKPDALRYIPIEIPDPPKQSEKVSYAPRNISSDYYNFEI